MSQDWRSEAAWAKVRKAALKRDRFTCQVCGTQKGELEVHHRWGAKHYPKERLKLVNLIVLCDPCHQDFHRWMGGTHVRCTGPDLEAYSLQRGRYGRAFFKLRLRHVMFTVAAGVAALSYLLTRI